MGYQDIALIMRRKDFNKTYGTKNGRYTDEKNHIRYYCVSCRDNLVGMRFDKVYLLDNSISLHNVLYNECLATRMKYKED